MNLSQFVSCSESPVRWILIWSINFWPNQQLVLLIFRFVLRLVQLAKPNITIPTSTIRFGIDIYDCVNHSLQLNQHASLPLEPTPPHKEVVCTWTSL